MLNGRIQEGKKGCLGGGAKKEGVTGGGEGRQAVWTDGGAGGLMLSFQYILYEGAAPTTT